MTETERAIRQMIEAIRLELDYAGARDDDAVFVDLEVLEDLLTRICDRLDS